MSFNFFFIVPIVILIVSFIYSVIYKDKEKTDEGFELVYFKLSYRRKMIRILWSLPIAALCYYVIYQYGFFSKNENLLIFIFLSGIFAVQFSYVYVKWRRIEMSDTNPKLS